MKSFLGTLTKEVEEFIIYHFVDHQEHDIEIWLLVKFLEFLEVSLGHGIVLRIPS
jgi:hypothetical protein